MDWGVALLPGFFFFCWILKEKVTVGLGGFGDGVAVRRAEERIPGRGGRGGEGDGVTVTGVCFFLNSFWWGFSSREKSARGGRKREKL